MYPPTVRATAMSNPSHRGSTPLSRTESYRWIVLGVAVTAQMLTALVSQGIYTLIPFWQAAYHLSQASAALPVSVMNGGQILSMLLLGRAIDRYGERGVVGSTVVVMGLAAFGAATLASNYLLLLLFLTLLGACYASVQPGGTRAIIRWFPSHQRGMAIGIRQAALPLGTGLAAATLPILAHNYGWSTAVCAAGTFGIIGGALFGAFHRDHARRSTGGDTNLPSSVAEGIKVLAKDSALRPVLIAGIASAAFQFTFSTHVIAFLSSRLKVEIVAAAFSFAVAQGVGIVGRISLPWVSDHFWPGKRLRSLSWTMCFGAIAGLALMALPAQSPSWLILTIFIALGLFGIGWYPLWLVEVAEMAPRNALGSTISFAMTLNLIAMSVMPPIFGLIVDLSGYSSAWMSLVAILVLAAFNLRRGASRSGFCRAELVRVSRGTVSL